MVYLIPRYNTHRHFFKDQNRVFMANGLILTENSIMDEQ